MPNREVKIDVADILARLPDCLKIGDLVLEYIGNTNREIKSIQPFVRIEGASLFVDHPSLKPQDDSALKAFLSSYVVQKHHTMPETGLQWTSNPPIGPGWYWWRIDATERAEIVLVLSYRRVFKMRAPTNSYWEAGTMGGEWYGPLQTPE